MILPIRSGASAIATVVLLASQAPARTVEWLLAVSVAMIVVTLALLFADRISKSMGQRSLMAMERLMGLVLTAIAVEMLLRGIEIFIREL